MVILPPCHNLITYSCEANDCVILNEPPAMMLTVGSTQVDCFNSPTGTATVSASGGAGNYQYAWNDINNQMTAQATNLPPGDYTVTVTDMNTCSQTVDVTVPNGTVITLSFMTTSPLLSMGYGSQWTKHSDCK